MDNRQNQVNINWYPGHMAKTKREITEDLKLVDVVIELLDSRIPIASKNPDIEELTKNKKKIIVLNKSDLADKRQNELWIKHFEKQGKKVVLTDCNTSQGINQTIKMVENIMKEEMKSYSEKGRIGRKIKAMVLGVPNVGKSTFINRIAKKNSLEVGNKPGVTKKKKWIRINDKVELLDTPGVLWPKFQNEQIALNLAITGTIKDEILPQTEIAYVLLKFLLENYRQNVMERYNFTKEYLDDILNRDESENINIYEIMIQIGKKRGCLVSGRNCR